MNDVIALLSSAEKSTAEARRYLEEAQTEAVGKALEKCRELIAEHAQLGLTLKAKKTELLTALFTMWSPLVAKTWRADIPEAHFIKIMPNGIKIGGCIYYPDDATLRTVTNKFSNLAESDQYWQTCHMLLSGLQKYFACVPQQFKDEGIRLQTMTAELEKLTESPASQN